MDKLFGTDGIRGKVNTYPITPEVALRLGKTVARVFDARGHGSRRAVLGKDTRLSGYMIETALTSGMVSMGMDVLEVGPMPTPAIAHLAKSMGAECGIMITASHNPAGDNGIKFFGGDGFKLPDALENEIESLVAGDEINSAHIDNEMIGKAYRVDDARGRYIEFVKSSINNRSLKGLKVVLDCANGAAYWVAPLILTELGAEVTTVNATPDGHNINRECGAVYPERLSCLVREKGADVGICLDGDADRVIFCDERGGVVDGDRIIGLCALDYRERSRLANNSVVVTEMSNLGFRRAMAEHGIDVDVVGVGDRNVIERMRRNGCNLGGEQSGHLIFMDYATTGDGLIAALHVLKVMLAKDAALSKLAGFMKAYPRRLTNIAVSAKPPLEELIYFSSELADCVDACGFGGRVMARYSGTENKLRILIEAEDAALVEEWSVRLARAVEKELG